MFNKKEYYRKYYKNNKEKYFNYMKKYQNSEKGKKKIKKWKEKNKEKIKKWVRNYEREKRNNDPTCNIKKKFLVRLRRTVIKYLETGEIKELQIHPVIKMIDKKKLTEYERILIGFEGINYLKIIEHLKPFPKDFLKNYQIDHIIPLSRFDFTKSKDIKECFKPENH
ncbi:MAG: hypothetical protein KAQ92_07430, partial [Candidatus Aenigmarchaeota archaeon]|nr:hypothetical protein [Candidatus Aenigmarchaeota archaeon]